MKKIKLAVLMGGKSSEHEISLLSGNEIIKNLDKNKYLIRKLIIPKSGEIPKIKKDDIDLVFISLHGGFGEDGKIQGFLDSLGVKYTGSNVLTSALAMDKLMFRMVMKALNIRIPKYISLKKNDTYTHIEKILGKTPYFVKPSNQGSSVGVSLVSHKNRLKRSLELAFRYSEDVLVDEYIQGREITVAVLGNSDPLVLPIIEIITRRKFFDYKAKYFDSKTKEVVPQKLSKSVSNKIQQLAIKIYKIVGCRGFARIDFILKDNKTPYLLELNTIPGLTPSSLLPKAARAYGLAYSQLLDKIIEYALE